MPTGLICDDMLDKLHVPPISIAEVRYYLIALREQILQNGCRAITSLKNFGILCRAIHVFAALKNPVKENLWMAIDLLYRLFNSHYK